MTVKPERVRLAAARGMANADHLAVACDRTGVPFHLGCALMQMESPSVKLGAIGGANIYGHDPGGALSTRDGRVRVGGHIYEQGADIPVTPANAAAFLIMIGAGAKSNGMGPCQLTYAGDLPDGRSGGYFRQMTDLGLVPWVPVDNMTFGLTQLHALTDQYGNIPDAGAHYNGGSSPGLRARKYGRDLAAYDEAWRHAFDLT